MAISFISQAAAEAATVALGTFAAGDIAVVFAFRDGVATAPSLPGTFTDIASAGTGSLAHRIGYRILQGGDTDIGTWTNATAVAVHVYRGQHATPIGGTGVINGSGTLISYPAIGAMSVGDGTSWVAGFAGHRAANTSLETPPASMTARSNAGGGGANEVAGHDTNGGVTSWSQEDVEVGGTTTGWYGRTVEIIAAAASAGVPVKVASFRRRRSA